MSEALSPVTRYSGSLTKDFRKSTSASSPIAIAMRKAFAERPSFLNDANACAVSSVDSPSVIITTVGAYALEGIFALSSMSCFIALRVPPRGVRP